MDLSSAPMQSRRRAVRLLRVSQSVTVRGHTHTQIVVGARQLLNGRWWLSMPVSTYSCCSQHQHSYTRCIGLPLSAGFWRRISYLAVKSTRVGAALTFLSLSFLLYPFVEISNPAGVWHIPWSGLPAYTGCFTARAKATIALIHYFLLQVLVLKLTTCDLEVTLILCQLSNPLVLWKVLSIWPFLILSSFKGFCLYVYMYIGLCFVCVVVRFMDIRVCHCITML